MSDSGVIIRDLEIMSKATNYRDWIFSHISEYLGNRIIEMGGGIGNYTSLFLEKELVIVTDFENACVEYLKELYSDNKNVIPLEMDISSHNMLDLRIYNPDTIVCLNVLEHVKDDERALEYMYEILTQSGKLALLVPAYPFLFGSIDRLVGHHRRYNKTELTKKITNAGFKITAMFYMNSIGVFGWYLNNRILHKHEESPAQIQYYDQFIVPWLRGIEDYVKPPFGLSLIALCEKMPDEDIRDAACRITSA